MKLKQKGCSLHRVRQGSDREMGMERLAAGALCTYTVFWLKP